VQRHADLAIAAAVAVLACAAAALGAPVAVTAVLGIALLAAPGYLLGQLLFHSGMAGLERLAVVTGLALCVPILGGLLLYAFGVPLHRAAWLGLLAGVTLLGDLALLLRRRGGHAAPFSWQWEGWRLPIPHVVAYGAAVVIVICAVGLARIGAGIQHYPGFTQLWLAHPNANADIADLGVGNYEGKTMRYRLVLVRNGLPPVTWNLTLANGQTWQRSPGFSPYIAADLYRLPDTVQPYRSVVIGAKGATKS
jgi:hypothetical protein